MTHKSEAHKETDIHTPIHFSQTPKATLKLDDSTQNSRSSAYFYMEGEDYFGVTRFHPSCIFIHYLYTGPQGVLSPVISEMLQMSCIPVGGEEQCGS